LKRDRNRNPKITDLTDDRPLKRKRSLDFIDEDDLEWLIGEEAGGDKEIDRTRGRGDVVHGRNPEIIDLTVDRPLKRKPSLVFVDDDDLEWLKDEVESIRDDMDDSSRDLGLRFAKIVRKVQQIS